MKILHTVESYHPSIGGMQEVVKQLSERLSKLGHDITVATSKTFSRKENLFNGVKIVDFNISGNLANGFHGDVEAYKSFLLKSDFDIITNFAAQQWATDGMIGILGKIKGKKIFVPTGFSGLYLPEYKEYFESMKIWMKQYDMNVFLSDNYRDINFARDYGVKNITLIPNGAGENEFLFDTGIQIRDLFGIPRDHFLILHVGSHTGGKGHSEAIKIFNSARINNTTFLLIANNLYGGCKNACRIKEQILNVWFKFNSKEKKLIVSSLSRAETIAAYKEADLFLFPSNIECSPLVLFECMASKTPFLTTDVGNSKEIISWSRSGILLPTIIDSKGYSKANIKRSKAILEEICGQSDVRKEMAETGFEAWQKRFTWEKITNNYENLYKTILQ